MPKMREVPQIKYWVHLMDLTSDDRHNTQLDQKYVPTPIINNRQSSSFRLSTSMEPAYEPSSFSRFSALLSFLSFSQLLENEKLLLVLVNRDKFLVYLERLPELDGAIRRGKPIKTLDHD